MKILITGGSGLLGQYLNIELSKENEILTVYNSNDGNCKNFNSVKISFGETDVLKDIFCEFKPDVVVHTAAISRPELCDELPKELVYRINTGLTKELAMLCERSGSKLIFTSTDLVYDGDIGQMLPEVSDLKPVSLYAETKVSGENEIRNIFENYIILRTSLLFGIGLNHSVNNFHNMLYSFRINKPVRLFHDQFRTPLSLLNAAVMISQLVRSDIKSSVLNFGGKERVSRVELGEILCDIGRFDRSLIEETSMYEIEKLHKVADVSMNTAKLRSLGIKQKTIEESVWEILKNN